MLKLYLNLILIKYMFIIYLIFLFSFFLINETDQNIKKLNLYLMALKLRIYADGVISPRQITETMMDL